MQGPPEGESERRHGRRAMMDDLGNWENFVERDGCIGYVFYRKLKLLYY